MIHNSDAQCSSSVSIVTRLQAGGPGFGSGQGQWQDLFLFATASRTVLGPTQPPIQGVPGGSFS